MYCIVQLGPWEICPYKFHACILDPRSKSKFTTAELTFTIIFFFKLSQWSLMMMTIVDGRDACQFCQRHTLEDVRERMSFRVRPTQRRSISQSESQVFLINLLFEHSTRGEGTYREKINIFMSSLIGNNNIHIFSSLLPKKKDIQFSR